jgi:hypothetical protein
MKLTTAILVLGMTSGYAFGQNPDIIENTRNTMHAIEQKKEIDSNAALATMQQPSGSPATSASPAPAMSASASASAHSAAKTAAKSKHAPAVQVKAVKATAKPAAKPSPKKKAVAAAKPAAPQGPVNVENAKSGDPKDAKSDATKPINLTSRRDPFVSPVVAHSMTGSGCSTGKRCLAIDQIALKGVVRADTGMIAVVVNAVNKAYFLRENDPVFNGYVVKITGDSIIFKETIQDKLGKPFEREVTKKITTPAV